METKGKQAAPEAPAQPPHERPGRRRARSVSFARDRSESASLRDRSRSRGRGRQPSCSPDRRRRSVEYGFDDYDYDSAANSPSRSRSRSRSRGRMSKGGILQHSPAGKKLPYPISRSPSRSPSRSRSRPGRSRRSSPTQRERATHHRNPSRGSLREKVKPLDAIKGAAPLLATIGVASVLAHKFWPKGVLYGDKEEWQNSEKPVKARQSHIVVKDRDGRVRRERHVREDGERRVVDDYDYRRGGGCERSYPERNRGPERPMGMYDDRRRVEPPRVRPRLEYGRGDGRTLYDERGLRGGLREYDERPVDRYSTRNWA